MASTKLIDDIVVILRQFYLEMDEVKFSCYISWDTFDRLTPGIIEKAEINVRRKPRDYERLEILQKEYVNFFIYAANAYELNYIFEIVFSGLYQISSPSKKRLLTDLLNSYNPTTPLSQSNHHGFEYKKLAAFLQECIVLIAIFNLTEERRSVQNIENWKMSRSQVDYQQLMGKVTDIFVQFTHRITYFTGLSHLVKLSNAMKTIRDEVFELRQKYGDILHVAAHSPLIASINSLYAKFGDKIFDPKLNKMPSFTSFAQQPWFIRKNVLKYMPVSSLLKLRTCSSMSRTMVDDQLKSLARKASEKKLTKLKAVQFDSRPYGRDNIYSVKFKTGTLMESRFFRPLIPDSSIMIEMKMESFRLILDVFGWPKEVMDSLRPEVREILESKEKK